MATVEEEIRLHKHVKAFHVSLGGAEVKRRAHLLAQANVLISCLVSRAHCFAPVDAEQARRSLETLKRAMVRVERRERAYYGPNS